jgi:hypothetical protein
VLANGCPKTGDDEYLQKAGCSHPSATSESYRGITTGRWTALPCQPDSCVVSQLGGTKERATEVAVRCVVAKGYSGAGIAKPLSGQEEQEQEDLR